jgi:hypothetical protein
LEIENAELHGKVHSYEDMIQRNNLWRFFRPHRGKTVMRDNIRRYRVELRKTCFIEWEHPDRTSVSFGRSPFKNQPVFTGAELRKILKMRLFSQNRQKRRQNENQTDQAAENDLHLL